MRARSGGFCPLRTEPCSAVRAGAAAFCGTTGYVDLIIRHGEDALCDICREHPRFYSYSENGNIREGGLGHLL